MFIARSIRTLVSVGILCAARVCASGSERKFAAPNMQNAAPVGTGSLLEVTISLLVVLAAIFAIAWLARRARSLGTRGTQRVEILEDIPLGVKERAVLLRVGSTTLLVGVAPGQVCTLHTLSSEDLLDTAADGEQATAPSQLRKPPTFAQLLRRGLGR